MSSGKIIGEGNEQYYQIDVEENFECKIKTFGKGKCEIFDNYENMFGDKEDVKYKISQIMPILFSIDGTFLKQNEKDNTKKLTKSIDTFFKKIENLKKKKNLSYLFPRIRFEFKKCAKKPIIDIITSLSKVSFIKDNYNTKFNTKFIDQLVNHDDENEELKNKINRFVLGNIEFLKPTDKPKWKKIIPVENLKKPFEKDKADEELKEWNEANVYDFGSKEANELATKWSEDPDKFYEYANKGMMLGSPQPKSSFKIIFKTQKKTDNNYFFYKKGNISDIQNATNIIYKEELINIGFIKSGEDQLENMDENDAENAEMGTKEYDDVEMGTKNIDDISPDQKMIEVGKREAEKAKKQQEIDDINDKLIEFCEVRQNGKNEQQEYLKKLLMCLNKNDKGKIKIIFNKQGGEVLPNYNLTNDYLRINPNGMKKKYTIELDELSFDDLLEPKSALDYEGTLNKLNKTGKGKMGDDEIKKVLLKNNIKPSTSWRSKNSENKKKLKIYLETKMKNPETKPLVEKLLTEFKKLGSNPFLCRKVLLRLKKVSVRKGFEKGFKKFDSDGDNALLEQEFKDFLHFMKAPVEDFDELWKRLSYDSDKIKWKTLMIWIKSGEWPKPVSIPVANQKLIYSKPKSVEFQLPKGVEPGQMLTIKIKKEIKYENMPYIVDLFVLLQPIPPSAKPGQKLSLKALKLAEPDPKDTFEYIIKKEKDGDAESAFYIKYGNNNIFVKLDEKGQGIYKEMKMNQVRALSMKMVNANNEKEKTSGMGTTIEDSLTTSDDAEIDKKTAMNVGEIENTDTGSEGTIGSKAAVRLVGTVATATAVAAPVAAVYGASLGISVIAEEGSSSAEVAEKVVDGMKKIYDGVKNFPNSSTIANVTEAGKDVIAFFSNPASSAASAGQGLATFASNAGSFLLTNATNVCTMVGLSAAAGPILLIALAGLAGLGVSVLIAKKAFVNGRNLYEWMNAKSLRYDVSSFKIERINLNISSWNYKKGEEVSGQRQTVMKVLKKYVIPKIVQDLNDPTKPIENRYPIYINNVQYVEEEEQETRSFSALEEDMKNERAQGIMVTPDMEGMDPADIKKAKVKKNVFYVRFHTNYITPFKLKGQEFALTSRGETYINKKLRTWNAFNKKKSNVYFYKGMVSLKEVNPSRKPPRKIFENVVKKLFKKDLKTLIFDQFSLDEEAADVIGERLKELKDSTVLEMVVLNLLEVPSIIKILKCLADSKIKIKKLVLRRVRDTIGKMKKKKMDDLYKMEKDVKKMQKGQQKVFADKKPLWGKRKSGNVIKGEDKDILSYQDGGGEIYLQDGGVNEIYLQHGGFIFSKSSEIMGTAVGSANLDLIVLELIRVIKSSSLTLGHLELPGQFGTKSTKEEDTNEIALKIGAAIKDANENEIRLKSGVGLMRVIYGKQIFGSSAATKTERKAQKRVFIENSVEMIRDQMEKVQADYDTILEKVEAEASADLLDFGDMHTIETFINPEEGIVNDLIQSIESLNRSTKSFFGKMKDVKYLLEELKAIETNIYKLKELEAYKEQLFEYNKFLDDKKEEEELQDLEDKSKKRDALKRGYTFDKKTHISLTIKHDIFDKMKPEKDSMIVRYNDEWNVPEIKFENPDKYRTGKKKYEYKFHFPTSIQKKEAYKRALKLRIDDKFFDNAIKVNYTNKTGEVIKMGMPITLTHPVYLVPISIQNPYTDNIDKGETVRLYLRGKVYKNNQMQGDDSNNFQVMDNNSMRNIVMIGIKDTDLAKFSIEDIKNNIMSFESRTENLASLSDIFSMFKQINPTMKINPDPLKFFNHEQFYIKSGICKRIFYEENVDIGDIIDDNIDYNNVFVFVYNSSLVSNRDIRINKEYGTIYANLEKVENPSLISYLEVKSPIGAKKIKENKISNIKFGRKGSEIYIMSVADLESTIKEEDIKKVDIEYEKNDAMVKAEEAEDAKSERLRQKYKKKENESMENLNETRANLKDEKSKLNSEVEYGWFRNKKR